jgi:RNA polymerase sigma factor (sigma-70 family)
VRTEDGYIIHKCLNGDAAAFGLLVDKYKTSIYALAYSKLGNFHDAEDITQEVFIKAYQKLHTLKRWDNFFAWLYSITSNLCKDLIRSHSKRPDREFIDDKNSGFFDYSSMNSYQEERVRESLYEALDSLPEMYRQVLTLYYLGGMSSKEIAQFLGTSESAIKQRLSRARSKLKKEMLDMMSKTYEQQSLHPSFTFRIVEMVKHIKIQPSPHTPLVPLGLSAATGIVLTVLMFSPYLISLTPFGALFGSPIPGKTKVMNIGEIPVDVLEPSEITFLSSKQGDGNNIVPKLPNPHSAFAPPLASSGESTKAPLEITRKQAERAVIKAKTAQKNAPVVIKAPKNASVVIIAPITAEPQARVYADSKSAVALHYIVGSFDDIQKRGNIAEGIFRLQKSPDSLKSLRFATLGLVNVPICMFASLTDGFALRYLALNYMEQPSLILKLPPQVGAEWTGIAYFDGFEGATVVESATEKVEVPAGIFEYCLKVKTTITGSAKKEVFSSSENAFIRGTRTMYFAPGVGLVKLEYQHETGHRTEIVLMDYATQRDTSYFPLNVDNTWTYCWKDGYFAKEEHFTEVWTVKEQEDGVYNIYCAIRRAPESDDLR